jgi:translation initiation factor 2 subunit 2
MSELPLIDFSILKKRRPKNYFEKKQQEDLENFEVVVEKKSKNIPTSDSSKIEVSVDSKRKKDTYTYEFLLERVSKLIKKNNPIMTEKSKVSLKAPIVNKVGTTRTAWINFVDSCTSLNRDREHLQQFILAELGNEGSLGQENQLIIKGRFTNKHIENLLTKYIKEYVTCQMCKSPSTILTKDNATRLQVMQCNICGSTRTVANIKVGFKGR